MPWWGRSFGPGTHAGPHAWQVLLALHGCSGEGTHREMSPMLSLQSWTAKSTSRKYRGHSSPGAGPSGFLCLEPGKGLEENVLVITDHFTRYAQAYVTRTQMAQTMAKTLWDKFIVYYGLPKKILTDQGHNFESVGGWPLWVDGSAENTD